jgi:hypothetical protein
LSSRRIPSGVAAPAGSANCQLFALDTGEQITEDGSCPTANLHR